MMKVFSVVILVTVGLFACQNETTNPGRPSVQQQAQKVQKTEPSKQPAAVAQAEEPKVEAESYLYDPKGRRDPFLSIIELSKKERESEKTKKGLKPSESYEVNEIKVIAIAVQGKKYFAMIQLPDKKYFTIREGMNLGLYGGKVVKIDPEGIVVREFLKNYRGEIQPKDTILKLRQEEGE
ncbi:MAG: pilus assembly protein PilP [Thermodesulfovibrionales bacterium]|jgi:type IV pilus assembly protein PilP